MDQDQTVGQNSGVERATLDCVGTPPCDTSMRPLTQMRRAGVPNQESSRTGAGNGACRTPRPPGGLRNCSRGPGVRGMTMAQSAYQPVGWSKHTQWRPPAQPPNRKQNRKPTPEAPTSWMLPDATHLRHRAGPRAQAARQHDAWGQCINPPLCTTRWRMPRGSRHRPRALRRGLIAVARATAVRTGPRREEGTPCVAAGCAALELVDCSTGRAGGQRGGHCTHWYRRRGALPADAGGKNPPKEISHGRRM